MSKCVGAECRFRAISEINLRVPRNFVLPVDTLGKRLRISEFFATNTFNRKQMRESLSPEIFKILSASIENGSRLDPSIASFVADAVKDWALSKGVTHFSHWFQPQTGLTAEKHDAFFSLDEDKNPIEKFSAQQLIQSEPDASSFPSGGMRTTFEARGYTAWDPSSPIFIMENASCKTLCIPSIFLSHHGHALDEKTALVRSIEVLSKRVCELLALSGTPGITRVVPTLGVEQEYFLIDRSFYSMRPDLIMTGRTILGGQPPKGQQLDDHYFGSIAARVQAFMSEMEYELYKLGVPVKTRHNEVAPSQFECAPIFEEADISTDHNQLMMEVLKKVAQRHHFAALLHEKPFEGVNGSGKHCNWSLALPGTNENLLEPGKTPHENLRFLLMLVSVLKGVHKHSGLLRAGVASSGNDHRLGANEAPPAIVSVFLGDMLDRILNEIERGAIEHQNPEGTLINLGLSRIPEIMRDNTDRNRTSPFAFTGNKFEFRAVGSSASVAFPVTLLNAAMADGVGIVTSRLKSKFDKGQNQNIAMLETIRELVVETKAIRFDGNNYAGAWIEEARRRGLPNHRKTPEALSSLIAKESVESLTSLGVFSEEELRSRYHVRIERYNKNISIEVETIRNLVETIILPACYAYHGTLAAGVSHSKHIGLEAPYAETLNELSKLISSLHKSRATLIQSTNVAEKICEDDLKAKFYAEEVSKNVAEVRGICDELEAMVADEYWPLPKYREMLFLS